MNQRPEAEQALEAAHALIKELATTIPDQGLKDNFLKLAFATLEPSW